VTQGIELTVPRAEIELSQRQVRALISSQHPELDITDLELLAVGWDNAAWLVNQTWVFRFPLHAGAGTLLAREVAVLPRLAGRLPLPIPVPVFVGHPHGDYPWPFFGARLIPGRELPEAGPPVADRVGVGQQLGSFLRRLHEPALAAEFDASVPWRPGRSDVARSLPRDLERLEAVAAAGLWSIPPRARGLISEATHLPPTTDLVLVHGDLHVRHLLVDDAAKLTGVIDWGDVCLAHPSADLQVGWSGFSGEARRAFLGAYGEIPHDWVVRARVSALFYSATLALYARRDGASKLEREAIAGLERAMDQQA
jgi:aminoglycoside phosphotransferase (APT) family kinase protein